MNWREKEGGGGQCRMPSFSKPNGLSYTLTNCLSHDQGRRGFDGAGG